MVKTHAQP